jgi:hypothetical protein
VILGDVFDSRCESSDSAGVYKLLRQAQMELGAIVLRSNHQDKLERFLKGNSVKVSPELERTIYDFGGAKVNPDELLAWLESLPYGFCFKYDNREYRCAHACFPSFLEVPDYPLFHFVMDMPRKARQLAMYGPVSREVGNPQVGGRVEWWHRDSERDWIRVAGHYHVVHRDERNLVLDAGCGGKKRSWFCNEAPALALFDVAKNEMIELAA